MDTTVSLGIRLNAGGQGGAQDEFHALFVVDVVTVGGEGELILGFPGVEGDAVRDAGVVRSVGAFLVGLGQGDRDRPFLVCVEGCLDGYGVALGHCVGVLLETHGHGGHIVVCDGDQGLLGAAFGDAGGQGWPKGQFHALTVVVERV